MNRDIVRQAAVVVALGVTLVMNYLGDALPVNGLTAAEISRHLPVWSAPAGPMYVIWTIIYLLLGAFALYQALPAQREDPRLRRAGWPFVASAACGWAWVLLWHHTQLGMAQLAMVGLVALLALTYGRLGIHLVGSHGAPRWLADAPISLYLGWMTIILLVNSDMVLMDSGWIGGPLGQAPWTMLILGLAAALALGVAFLRHDGLYGLAVAWGLAGVWLARQADAPTVALVAALAAALVLAGSGWALLRWQTRTPRRRRGAAA